MEVIKFSDFIGGNYGEYVEKRSFQDTLKTILVAMLIVYFSPLVIHTVADVFYKVMMMP